MLRKKMEEKDINLSINTHDIPDNIKAIFKKFSKSIDLFLFTSHDKNTLFCDISKKVLHIFTQLTTKINLREFDITHKEARRLDIEYSREKKSQRLLSVKA